MKKTLALFLAMLLLLCAAPPGYGGGGTPDAARAGHLQCARSEQRPDGDGH